MKFVLASASPRRQELLKEIIPEFEVCPSNTEERINK
ncbi:MAG: Maf family protein, partial [Eubacterium sp.]|nr:Maf family protein [Eubacterium sp.]